jgi:hypothetical protein
MRLERHSRSLRRAMAFDLLLGDGERFPMQVVTTERAPGEGSTVGL